MIGHLRPVDLARAVGLGVQQVRNYEAWGFLPPAERSPRGYRRYTPRHLEALKTARTLIRGYGWQRTLEVMRALHNDDLDAALALVDARHAELDRDRRRVEQTLAALHPVTSESVEYARVRSPRYATGSSAGCSPRCATKAAGTGSTTSGRCVGFG